MADYDVIVLGGGPGGYLAAERLGHARKKVALIEEQYLGGTCLNVGCIPTKSLLNSAKLYLHARHSQQFGVFAEDVRFNWDQVQAWKDSVVTTLVSGVAATEKKAGVEVVNGHGTLIGPGVVEVNGERKTADHVIIATGSVPVMPPIPGAKDNPAVVDSTGLLALPTFPDKLVVIGGGVIGVEFASLFAAFGAQVEVIELLPEIVPFADADVAQRLRKGIEGVTFHLNCKVTGIEGPSTGSGTDPSTGSGTDPSTGSGTDPSTGSGGVVVYTDATGAEVRTAADVILMAVGRRPALTGWGAEEAGLATTPKGVVVDDTMRTNLPNVWAVGDVTGRSLLAHAAYRMAEIAVAHILDTESASRKGQVLRTETIPWAVYSIPEAAGVGLTEAQARDKGLDVVTATIPLALSGRFIAENGLKAPGAVKLIAEKESRVIRGIHALGPYSPETIWGAAAVLESEYTVDDLRQVVFPHPTVSEGIREAAWAVRD